MTLRAPFALVGVLLGAALLLPVLPAMANESS